MRTSRYSDSGGRPLGSSAGIRREDAAEMAERYVYTPETKEFFRTSEFLLWLLAIAGVFIASGMNEEFDSKSAWTVFTILTTGYIVSRGLAKAGTRRGWNDRYWTADERAGYPEGTAASRFETQTDSTVDLGGTARNVGRSADEAADTLMEEVRTPETKEFFRTSEFLMWLLGTAGILIASAYETGFGASSAWTMVTVLSSGYILSRALAKAGTARGFEAGAARRYGRLSEVSTPETKESFRTSELAVLVLTVLGVLLASGADSAFDAPGAWRLVAAVATTYIVARGIAKIGTPQETDGRRTMIA